MLRIYNNFRPIVKTFDIFIVYYYTYNSKKVKEITRVERFNQRKYLQDLFLFWVATCISGRFNAIVRPYRLVHCRKIFG